MLYILKKIVFALAFIFLIGIVSGAEWVDDPLDCPQTYQSQTCTGSNLVCGYSGGVTYCYLPPFGGPPSADEISNAGDTYQASFTGGFIIDCVAYDSGEPHCDNSAGFWCNRNNTCYTTYHRKTNCTGGMWANTTGSSSCEACRTGYLNCTAVHSDPTGCEVQYGYTNCAAGANNNINSTCGCVCDSGYLDCDASGAGVGNGCEVQDGGSCTVGALSGTYSGCTCVVDQSYFETGTFTEYLTNTTQSAMLWFKNYFASGDLINATNANNQSFIVDKDTNIITEGNLTMGNKITMALGVVWESISSTWAKITGSLQITKDLNVTGIGEFQNITVRDNNICNETVCWTLQDLNTSGSGGSGGNSTYNATYHTWAYNQTIPAINDINARFWNRTQSYNKSEVDNNLSLYLLLTDQRFNETDLFDSTNTTANIMALGFYNKSEVDNNFSLYLLLTDQRFNETDLILSVNTTLNVMSLGFYNTSEIDNNFSLYMLLTDQRFNETAMILSVNTTLNIQSLGFYNKTQIDAFNVSWSSTYNSTYATWAYNQTTPAISYADATFITLANEGNLNVNKSDYWDNMGTINTTQMENSGGTLNILVSWLTGLFYIKSEVYNTTETYTKTEIDNNLTGQGYIDSANVAYYNQTNVWAENQNFSKNLTMNGGDILLNDNASITREGVGTKTWLSESGNWITQFSS